MQKKREYIILSVTILFTIVSLFVFFFVLKQIKTKNENALVAKQHLDEKNLQKKNFSNLERTIQETKEQREILNSYIVQEDQIDKFIGWLETQGEPFSARILVDSVSHGKKENTLDVSLTTKGSFNSVLLFSYFLESSELKIEIEKLFLSKLIEEGDKDTPSREYWQAKIDFSVISDIKK